MTRRSGAASVCLAVVVSLATAGCTDGDSRSSPDPPSTTTVVDGARYEFELLSLGDGERQRLVTVVPVGRQATVRVRLSSRGDVIEVGLLATVLRADAEGQSEDVELRVVSIDADDQTTVDGLAPVLDASSVVRRDRRRAVVEQVLDVPEGLSFRADAVARQALRAPFALAGPLPLEPVGRGAQWNVTSFEDGLDPASREITVVDVGPESFVLRFDVPDGSVELLGRPGQLLPTEQLIELDDAELLIVSEQAP